MQPCVACTRRVPGVYPACTRGTLTLFGLGLNLLGWSTIPYRCRKSAQCFASFIAKFYNGFIASAISFFVALSFLTGLIHPRYLLLSGSRNHIGWLYRQHVQVWRSLHRFFFIFQNKKMLVDHKYIAEYNKSWYKERMATSGPPVCPARDQCPSMSIPLAAVQPWQVGAHVLGDDVHQGA